MKWLILICLLVFPRFAQAESTPGEIRDALRIDALINQELNPGVDADALFEFSVDDVQGKYGLEELARLVSTDDPPPSANPGEEASFRLFESRLSFLRFPESQREELLNTHREKHVAFLAKQSLVAEQLATLSKQKSVWERLLKGERVEGGVDWVLRIDANDPNEFINDPVRRERFLNLDVEAPDLSGLEKAQREVDALRFAFSGFAPEKRAELVQMANSDPPAEPTAKELEDKRAEAENEAAQAQREREQAIEESKTARTEALKRVATARVTSLQLLDTVAELAPIESLSIRAGKFKVPTSADFLISAPSTGFVNRGLLVDMVQKRRVGAELEGRIGTTKTNAKVQLGWFVPEEQTRLLLPDATGSFLSAAARLNLFESVSIHAAFSTLAFTDRDQLDEPRPVPYDRQFDFAVLLNKAGWTVHLESLVNFVGPTDDDGLTFAAFGHVLKNIPFGELGHSLEPGFRYDVINRESDLLVHRMTTGLNYYVFGDYLNATTNYELAIDRDDLNHTVYLQLQAGFSKKFKSDDQIREGM